MTVGLRGTPIQRPLWSHKPIQVRPQGSINMLYPFPAGRSGASAPSDTGASCVAPLRVLMGIALSDKSDESDESDQSDARRRGKMLIPRSFGGLDLSDLCGGSFFGGG